jgi:hypothetical protein
VGGKEEGERWWDYSSKISNLDEYFHLKKKRVSNYFSHIFRFELVVLQEMDGNEKQKR